MCHRCFSLAIITCCLAAQGSSAQQPQKADHAPSENAALQKLSSQLGQLKAKIELDKAEPARPLYTIHFEGFNKVPAADMAQLRLILQDTSLPISLSLIVGDAELAHLKDLKCIRSLSLHGTFDVSDAGMEHVASLGNLEYLWAGSVQVTDTGLAQISKLKKLRDLRFRTTLGNTITDAGLAHLSALTNLESIDLTGNQITNAGLAHLSKLKNLQYISVRSSSVTGAGYAHLAGLTALQGMNVGNFNIGDVPLSHMKGLVHLQGLWIGGRLLTDAGMADLGKISGLKQLTIKGGEITGAGFSRLAGLKKLEKLTLQSCDFLAGDALAALPALTALRELNIEKSPIDLQAARHISKAKSVEKLHLEMNVDDDVFEGIGGMANLKELTFGSREVRDPALSHLGGLKSLRILTLRNTLVTDAGLSHLSGLTKLEELYLGGTSVTDAGLKHLAGLTGLKTLSLIKCKIAGPGLKDLAALSNLETLWLDGTRLTNDAVPHLYRLTKLTKVSVSGTEVDRKVLLALKKALPGATITDAYGEEVGAAKPRKIEDLSKTKADFTLTAIQYFAEFKADWSAASKKFKNKVVELTGVPTAVSIAGEPYMRLEARDEKRPQWSPYEGVECFTADPQPWAKYSRGQTVKLRGRQGDRDPNKLFADIIPALFDCVILEASPNPAIVVSAEELAKEVAADPKAARKKYSGKYALISGTIAAREVRTNFTAALAEDVFVLKTEGKVQIGCSVSRFQNDRARGLKVGDMVTMYGSISIRPGNEIVSVEKCLPIKKD